MTQYIDIEKIRPNNWFLEKGKLEKIREIWNNGEQRLLPAITVTLIDGEFSLIDGHCRAYVAMENGAWGILAEIVEPSQFAHKIKWLTIFHRQGPFIGIRNIQDLSKRIIESETENGQSAQLLQFPGQTREIKRLKFSKRLETSRIG